MKDSIKLFFALFAFMMFCLYRFNAPIHFYINIGMLIVAIFFAMFIAESAYKYGENISIITEYLFFRKIPENNEELRDQSLAFWNRVLIIPLLIFIGIITIDVLMFVLLFGSETFRKLMPSVPFLCFQFYRYVLAFFLFSLICYLLRIGVSWKKKFEKKTFISTLISEKNIGYSIKYNMDNFIRIKILEKSSIFDYYEFEDGYYNDYHDCQYNGSNLMTGIMIDRPFKISDIDWTVGEDDDTVFEGIFFYVRMNNLLNSKLIIIPKEEDCDDFSLKSIKQNLDYETDITKFNYEKYDIYFFDKKLSKKTFNKVVFDIINEIEKHFQCNVSLVIKGYHIYLLLFNASLEQYINKPINELKLDKGSKACTNIKLLLAYIEKIIIIINREYFI